MDVARTAAAEGHEVLLYDAEHPVDVDGIDGDVEVLPGEWAASHLDGVDRVVTSPWFPETSGPLLDVLERSIPVVTEAGFGLERLSTPYVAVTGTNGKTTVTEETAAMLRASGVDTPACGNVGTPTSSISEGDTEVLLIELSSYQLRFMGTLAPIAAALLNIAPDHLDWHGSFDRYVAAKARIFATMGPDEALVYDVDDPVAARTVAAASCRLMPCSGTHLPEGGNGVVDGCLVVDGHRIPTAVNDPTFLFDLVAAATLALEAGGDVDGVAKVAAAFTPGEHRRRVVATIDGVTWIDDSKATNPHAAVAAARSYDDVVLLVGGRNKGLDLSPLTSVPGVRRVVAFGEAAAEIAAAADSEVVVVPTLASAVAKAREIAEEGDTVLLSPGCASFDEFGSYAERGDAYARLVLEDERVEP